MYANIKCTNNKKNISTLHVKDNSAERTISNLILECLITEGKEFKNNLHRTLV